MNNIKRIKQFGGVSVGVREAIMRELEKLPATSNGTEVAVVVGSGEEAFNDYPAVRVLPLGSQRLIDSERRWCDYEIRVLVSLYLRLGDGGTPDSEVIDTMVELVDLVHAQLDWGDIDYPDIYGARVLVGTSSTSVMDTAATPAGTALFCDIEYPVIYRMSLQ